MLLIRRTVHRYTMCLQHIYYSIKGVTSGLKSPWSLTLFNHEWFIYSCHTIENKATYVYKYVNKNKGDNHKFKRNQAEDTINKRGNAVLHSVLASNNKPPFSRVDLVNTFPLCSFTKVHKFSNTIPLTELSLKLIKRITSMHFSYFKYGFMS